MGMMCIIFARCLAVIISVKPIGENWRLLICRKLPLWKVGNGICREESLKELNITLNILMLRNTPLIMKSVIICSMDVLICRI